MIIVTYVKKNMQLEYAVGKRCLCHRKCWVFDSYDQLLLQGHRLFAQLQVFASGEHFVDELHDLQSGDPSQSALLDLRTRQKGSTNEVKVSALILARFQVE